MVSGMLHFSYTKQKLNRHQHLSASFSFTIKTYWICVTWSLFYVRFTCGLCFHQYIFLKNFFSFLSSYNNFKGLSAHYWRPRWDRSRSMGAGFQIWNIVFLCAPLTTNCISLRRSQVQFRVWPFNTTTTTKTTATLYDKYRLRNCWDS